MKCNITDLDGALDRLLQLRPVSYRFRSAPKNAPRSLGLIAQEVEPLFPEVVGEGMNGMKDIAYNGLIPVAIRSIQELEQKMEDKSQESESRIQKLEAENAELDQKNQLLERRLDALEK
ncbi:MAG TPA: tail fiber domain-containing protein, partial [Verrucomicrobiae bacterium]|nr:tail fiber domain-containing protein [Verrucomicrobiae bacterium]